MDFKSVLARFICDRKANGRAVRTIDDYHRVLEPFGRWCGEQGIDVRSLDVDAVRTYVAGLYDNGWGRGTVGIHVRNLRAFLRWLFTEEMVGRNLALAIKAPRCVIRPEDLPTPTELMRLVNVCGTDPAGVRDRAIILALLDTGLRIGEMSLLQRKQVRFDPDGQNACIQVYAPKTKTFRLVFLGSQAASAMAEYLSGRTDACPDLWYGVRGPMTSGGIYRVVQRRAIQANLEPSRVHPHAFRKLFATLWTENGGDRTRLKALGGWETDEMLEVYVVLADRHKLAQAHRRYGPVDRLLAS